MPLLVPLSNVYATRTIGIALTRRARERAEERNATYHGENRNSQGEKEKPQNLWTEQEKEKELNGAYVDSERDEGEVWYPSSIYEGWYASRMWNFVAEALEPAYVIKYMYGGEFSYSDWVFDFPDVLYEYNLIAAGFLRRGIETESDLINASTLWIGNEENKHLIESLMRELPIRIANDLKNLRDFNIQISKEISIQQKVIERLRARLATLALV